MITFENKFEECHFEGKV